MAQSPGGQDSCDDLGRDRACNIAGPLARLLLLSSVCRTQRERAKYGKRNSSSARLEEVRSRARRQRIERKPVFERRKSPAAAVGAIAQAAR
jgi:hypothetical protein